MTSSLPKERLKFVGRIRAIYGYNAETDEELSIVPGEILEVIRWDAGEGWMEAYSEARRIRGLLPASYATPL